MINWEQFDNGNMNAFYGSTEWRHKRDAARKRDHNLCQRCMGKWDRQKRIVYRHASLVHHIIPVQKDHSLALVDSNLVSLCFACHEEVEGRDNFKPFKKKETIAQERW